MTLASKCSRIVAAVAAQPWWHPQFEVWVVATATALTAAAATVPASAAARCTPVLWTQAQARQASDAVVDVELADPAVRQIVVPRSGTPAFVRQTWLLRLRGVVWQRHAVADPAARAALAALALGTTIAVDEADWRGALAHHRRCASGSCPDRCAPTLQSLLSREPVAGARVRAWLRWTRDGWALSAERGFDVAEEARR